LCKVIKSLRDFISGGVVSGKNLFERGVEAHGTLRVLNRTRGSGFKVRVDLDRREKDVVMAGGLRQYLRLRRP
jgi:hypothetical protein